MEQDGLMNSLGSKSASLFFDETSDPRKCPKLRDGERPTPSDGGNASGEGSSGEYKDRSGRTSDSGFADLSAMNVFSPPAFECFPESTSPMNLQSGYDFRSRTWSPLKLPPRPSSLIQRQVAMLRNHSTGEEMMSRPGPVQRDERVRSPWSRETEASALDASQRTLTLSQLGLNTHAKDFSPSMLPYCHELLPLLQSATRDQPPTSSFDDWSWDRKFRSTSSLPKLFSNSSNPRSFGAMGGVRASYEGESSSGAMLRNPYLSELTLDTMEPEWDTNPFRLESRMKESSAMFPKHSRCLSHDVASLDLAFCGLKIRDPSKVWYGSIQGSDHKTAMFSSKVFLGGVPWDTTEEMVMMAFQAFGNVRVEWPMKDNVTNSPKGYLYVVFETERQVKYMLGQCTFDKRDGGSYYFRIASRKHRSKEVQVIPWVISDSTYVRHGAFFPEDRLDIKKTVFVGALHGVITAKALFVIMDDLFGDVVYAAIDTDKFKYPIGSGRVTFGNFDTFMKAVMIGYVEVKTSKFFKKLQLDPYLEDATCVKCNITSALYFCRDLVCFQYYCRTCWCADHPSGGSKEFHKVIMRTERNTVMRHSFVGI